MTREEYLEFERVAETKHEYWSGHVVDLSGVSLAHAWLTTHIASLLSTRLPPACHVFSSDLRVRIDTDHYVYPDVTVTCKNTETTGENPPALINPSLVVEITSPSTEALDRGDKLFGYTNMPSVQEYWIVSQDEWAVTRYFRSGTTWGLDPIHGPSGLLQSTHFGLNIPLSEIYSGIEAFQTGEV